MNQRTILYVLLIIIIFLLTYVLLINRTNSWNKSLVYESVKSYDESGDPKLTRDSMLVSQLCTQSQFETELYDYWCDEIKEKKRFHRKQWEFIYIAQALSERGMLKKGNRGLGFGVGNEPLPSLFAKYGVKVVATDLDRQQATKVGWAGLSNKSEEILESLYKKEILPDFQVFKKNVETRPVNMNEIPEDLRDFDFTWSSCAIEHVGSLELAAKVVENSLKTLKPGGVAIHTTEYNLSSEEETVESGSSILFRKKDILKLAKKLTDDGHHIKLNLNKGNRLLDNFVDLPPFSENFHLRLVVGGYKSTSIGLIITKKK